tara:strand:- start:6391 stop:6627 length:237 start_codon:yes stop_codon:yes gene_type:complete
MSEDDKAMLLDIHRALFDVPTGSGAEEKPLIEGMRIVWRSYQRGSWAFRAVVWVLPAIAGVGIAAEKIKEWLLGGATG